MKPNISSEEVALIRELRSNEMTYLAIANKIGRSKSTVHKVCTTSYIGSSSKPPQPQSEAIVISWKQLSLIPESATKTAILHALDIQVPPQGISKQFQLSEKPGEETVTYTDEGFVYYKDRSSVQRASGSAILKLTRRPKGTPTGDALRAWLRRWGWVPKGELEANAKSEVSR